MTETDRTLGWWRDAALDKASYNPEWAIRMKIASHPYASAETLTRLATDVHIFVRDAVRYNPHTPALVKVWLESEYGGMTLEQFLEAAK